MILRLAIAIVYRTSSKPYHVSMVVSISRVYRRESSNNGNGAIPKFINPFINRKPCHKHNSAATHHADTRYWYRLRRRPPRYHCNPHTYHMVTLLPPPPAATAAPVPTAAVVECFAFVCGPSPHGLPLCHFLLRHRILRSHNSQSSRRAGNNAVAPSIAR
eukprot:scaffold3124_cov67-Cyclotella_meneghiniana.AAC.1